MRSRQGQGMGNAPVVQIPEAARVASVAARVNATAKCAAEAGTAIDLPGDDQQGFFEACWLTVCFACVISRSEDILRW
eukprot:4715105-Amphidinium_carterae.1